MNMWFITGLWLGLGMIVALALSGVAVITMMAIYLWNTEKEQRRLHKISEEIESVKWGGTD